MPGVPRKQGVQRGMTEDTKRYWRHNFIAARWAMSMDRHPENIAMKCACLSQKWHTTPAGEKFLACQLPTQQEAVRHG